jgi:hypothetical protein
MSATTKAVLRWFKAEHGREAHTTNEAWRWYLAVTRRP